MRRIGRLPEMLNGGGALAKAWLASPETGDSTLNCGRRISAWTGGLSGPEMLVGPAGEFDR